MTLEQKQTMKAFELLEQLKQELADMTLSIEDGWISSLDVMAAVKATEELAKVFNTEQLKALANKEAVMYGKDGYKANGYCITAKEAVSYSYSYPAPLADMISETDKVVANYKKAAQALQKMGHGEASVMLPTGELVEVQTANASWTQTVNCAKVKGE